MFGFITSCGMRPSVEDMSEVPLQRTESAIRPGRGGGGVFHNRGTSTPKTKVVLDQVQGILLWVSGLRFRVWGLGCRVLGVGFRISGFGCGVSVVGYWVWGVGFRVQGSGCRV